MINLELVEISKKNEDGCHFHFLMNMGTNFTFHKVMTKISWLDKISWPDMSCWGVEVIKAILKCYWILICDYVDAFGTKVLVMGTICCRKTNLRFESHGWTSVEHDI